MQLFQYTKDRLLKNDREKKKERKERKKKIIRHRLVSIVSRRFLAINFRKEGVKLTQRVPRLALDINVYTCLAGQKANKAIVPRGLRKG